MTGTLTLSLSRRERGAWKSAGRAAGEGDSPERAPGFSGAGPGYCSAMLNSVRRFSARPRAVALEAIGFASP